MATIEDFTKIEIKVGTVLTCEKVEGTDKLLKLEIDFGEETRTILTGLAQHLEPEHFVGKQIPAIVNLEPRKLRGIESQGMILSVFDKDGKPTLIHPEKEVENGSEVA